MAKNEVRISENVCKGCGLCVAVCPKAVLELSRDSLNDKGYSPSVFMRPEKCIACGMCGIMCPDSAIMVFKE